MPSAAMVTSIDNINRVVFDDERLDPCLRKSSLPLRLVQPRTSGGVRLPSPDLVARHLSFYLFVSDILSLLFLLFFQMIVVFVFFSFCFLSFFRLSIYYSKKQTLTIFNIGYNWCFEIIGFS